MAFGFPAYHTDIYKMKSGQSADSIVVLKTALKILSWPIKEEAARHIIASTSLNLRSWGEKIEINVLPDNSISITSKCSMPTQCFDWGKNKANVDKFLAEVRKHA